MNWITDFGVNRPGITIRQSQWSRIKYANSMNHWLLLIEEETCKIWLSDDLDGHVKFGDRSPYFDRKHPCINMQNWEWA